MMGAPAVVRKQLATDSACDRGGTSQSEPCSLHHRCGLGGWEDVRRTLTLTTVADSTPVYTVVAGAVSGSIGFGRSAVCSARSANTGDGALDRCSVCAKRVRSMRTADAARGGAETAKQRTVAADVAPPAIV